MVSNKMYTYQLWQCESKITDVRNWKIKHGGKSLRETQVSPSHPHPPKKSVYSRMTTKKCNSTHKV